MQLGSTFFGVSLFRKYHTFAPLTHFFLFEQLINGQCVCYRSPTIFSYRLPFKLQYQIAATVDAAINVMLRISIAAVVHHFNNEKSWKCMLELGANYFVPIFSVNCFLFCLYSVVSAFHDWNWIQWRKKQHIYMIKMQSNCWDIKNAKKKKKFNAICSAINILEGLIIFSKGIYSSQSNHN